MPTSVTEGNGADQLVVKCDGTWGGGTPDQGPRSFPDMTVEVEWAWPGVGYMIHPQSA